MQQEGRIRQACERLLATWQRDAQNRVAVVIQERVHLQAPCRHLETHGSLCKASPTCKRTERIGKYGNLLHQTALLGLTVCSKKGHSSSKRLQLWSKTADLAGGNARIACSCLQAIRRRAPLQREQRLQRPPHCLTSAASRRPRDSPGQHHIMHEK